MTFRPYQAKFKLTPDGRGSLLRVLAPSKTETLGNRLKVQQSAKVDENGEVTGLLDNVVIQPNNLRAGWGGLGNKDKMSKSSQYSLKGRLAAMELEFGVENVVFPTLTLPTVDISAYEGVARYSSYIANRLGMILDRYFDNDIFGRMSRAFIWEYQSRGALHLHIAIACHCMDAISIKDFEKFLRLKWVEILESVSEIYGCNCFINSSGREWNIWELLDGYVNKKGTEINFIPKALCKVEFVSKSIIAYLSDYLSDSNHDDLSSPKQLLREKFYPIASWSQWNREATRCFKKWNVEIDLGFIDSSDLQAFDDCVEILENSVPMLENTESLPPRNPYVTGFCFLANRLTFPVDMIKDFKKDMMESGIIKSRLHYMKDKFELSLNHAYRRGDLDLGAYKFLYQSLDIKRYKNRVARGIVKKFSSMFGLFDLIKECANVVSNQYVEYQQMELFYELEKEGI